MKVLIITHFKERHYYFCNHLIGELDVIGVMTGAKNVNRGYAEKLKSALGKGELKRRISNMPLNLIYKKYGSLLWDEKARAEEDFFGGSAAYFGRRYGHLLLARVTGNFRRGNERQEC